MPRSSARSPWVALHRALEQGEPRFVVARKQAQPHRVMQHRIVGRPVVQRAQLRDAVLGVAAGRFGEKRPVVGFLGASSAPAACFASISAEALARFLHLAVALLPRGQDAVVPALVEFAGDVLERPAEQAVGGGAGGGKGKRGLLAERAQALGQRGMRIVERGLARQRLLEPFLDRRRVDVARDPRSHRGERRERRLRNLVGAPHDLRPEPLLEIAADDVHRGQRLGGGAPGREPRRGRVGLELVGAREREMNRR